MPHARRQLPDGPLLAKRSPGIERNCWAVPLPLDDTGQLKNSIRASANLGGVDTVVG